jgi:3',5'-cyclic AMP phosphodiesterase CpdA
LVDLASKRLLGFLNWHLHRSRTMMQGDSVKAVVADIHARRVNHIAITGDLINIGLPDEITNARNWLASVGQPVATSLVPGNHDAYVPGALDRAIDLWKPYVAGDDEPAGTFPFVRRRGPLAIIGVSSAIATGPFMATGRVDATQLERLRKVLRDTAAEGRCRVVLIHHLAIDGATKWKSRLLQAEAFRTVIAEVGAELLLHGHTHRSTTHWLQGPTSPVPVIGVQAASLQPSLQKRGAGWNLFEIDGGPGDWRIMHIDRGIAAGAQTLSEIARQSLT